MGARLHSDEIPCDAAVVSGLVTRQFPDWTGLPVERVDSAGTSNWLFRLGDELVVRLPRRPASAPGIEHERAVLERLAGQLPVAVPRHRATGSPDEGFAYPWAVYEWIEGADAMPERIGDRGTYARDLAGFVRALRAVDARGGPAPSPGQRGNPLIDRDPAVRRCLGQLEGEIDVAAATRAWEACLAAPDHAGPPAWLHGDLHATNLLMHEGRLAAVLDFGLACVGDPAADLTPAWTEFSGEARELYRSELGVDEAEWTRGRGWTLAFGLLALPYYLETNPVFVMMARHAIAEALADPKAFG